MYLLLALTAGDWGWVEAWVVAGIYLGWVSATVAVVGPRNPDLLAERAERHQPEAKRWDKVVLGLYGVETLARYVVAGLDHRFAWTSGFPVALQVVGAALSAAGFAMVVWSMWANNWFATVVRIQGDRDQQVVDTGPYALVRHPGYLGTFGFEVGTAMVLGSWPAVGVGLLGCALLVYRTAREDRTLHDELAGYPDYAGRVRHRLIPGVW